MKNKNKVNVIKIGDIDKVFSEKLSELLSSGLTIYTNPMGGSQGDRAAIYLTDRKDVYCLRITRKTIDNPSDKYDRIDIMCIILEIFKDEYRSDNFNQTLWNGKGGEAFSIKYYQIGCYDFNVFVETIEEYNTITDIKQKRRDNKRKNNDKKLNINPEKIIHIVNSKKGYKTVRKSQIEKIYKHSLFCENSWYYEIRIKDKKPLIIGNYRR